MAALEEPMHWTDELARGLQGPQTINDSKTPSGRVHVGALRGVLIHDAMFRVLQELGLPVRYLYGVDDFDPVDETPAGLAELYRPHLGKPLCMAPAPPGSSASDMAEHFIGEFLDVFRELEVHAEIYRMRDIYRTGRFNEAIDRILSQAEAVREIYLQVSNSQRAEHWYPFQTICEQCGRIGTTEVYHYDGSEVSYRCRPDLVRWAQGCGYQGKVSPFDGKGKLPWKLEWVAKWASFPVTIEGAGKDHSTAGGSRDVSEALLRRLFGLNPPLNIPYEFFLVGGAKMSSSKGLGVSAREMSRFLPPEILRFLLIRPKPQRPVNFEPDEKNITKLFNEYDHLHRASADGSASAEELRVQNLSDPWKFAGYLENFQVLTTLIQMPHLHAQAVVESRKGSPLNQEERGRLERRVQAAKIWLEHYATEEDRIELQQELPARAHQLSPGQAAFLHGLAAALEQTSWQDEAIQTALYGVTRNLPFPQPKAFQALYRVFLDRDSGPKAGNLLGFLEKTFVLQRLRALPLDEEAFCAEAGLDLPAFEAWLKAQKKPVTFRGMEKHETVQGALFLRGEQNGKELRVLLLGAAADDLASHVRALLKEDLSY
jgi:lysyl-tRNA synthetase class 1